MAFSHGEGKFVADETWLRTLADNGQIATQYVDETGTPSMDGEYNINGSAWAVEGITSEDGRVLGKWVTASAGKKVCSSISTVTGIRIFSLPVCVSSLTHPWAMRRNMTHE